MRETIDLSEALLFICRDCKVLVGRDIVYVGRRRCALCGRQNARMTPDEVNFGQRKNGKVMMKGKDGKPVQRFPRLLAGTADQQKIVEDILRMCRDFDCPGKIKEIHNGPVVTEYEFEPDRFTRVKRLRSLTEDLAVMLKVESVTVRKLAGKGTLGISIANNSRKQILFKDAIQNVIAHRFDMELPLNMGVTSDGDPYVEDLATYPHLLIGGSTGAGKSVFLNHLLTNLLAIRSPKQLRLYLIDPKSVELFPYKGIAHLKQEPVNDVYRALGLLDEVEQEMRRRTSQLHALSADNIKQLNDRIKAEAAVLRKEGKAEAAARREDDQWPYIVVVIDEMADLVLQEKKMFIEKMAAISQMARAAGICVISATQRPSVDVLPGKIKVNFPARAAFRMPSQQDSKTVLNYKGAESLLGKGDMFLVSPHKSGLQRIHVPLITREERDAMLRQSLEAGYLKVPVDLPKETPATPPPPTTNGKAKLPKSVN